MGPNCIATVRCMSGISRMENIAEKECCMPVTVRKFTEEDGRKVFTTARALCQIRLPECMRERIYGNVENFRKR